MARKSSPIEDLFDIVRRLPWWLGLVMAISSYVYLHGVATAVQVPGNVGNGIAVSGMLAKAFANVLQYILPSVFTLAALASFVDQRRRRREYGRVAPAGLQSVTDISWREFERVVGEAFRHKGYAVTETTSGADGGVDLSLRRDGEEHLVQCKHWRANKVGVGVVRELHGVMASRGAAGGFVVTAGEFTAPARKYASGRNIELIGANQFAKLMAQGRAVVESTPVKLPPSAEDGPAPPACPRCRTVMVERVAKKGPNSGNRFWGCPHFPKCRGTLPIG